MTLRLRQKPSEPRNQRGQSTVEFALIVPLIMIVLLAVVQVGLVVYAKLGVTHLAREVARAVAVDPNAEIAPLIQDRSGLGPSDPEITVYFEEGLGDDRKVVVVTVLYQPEAIIGLFNGFSDSFRVQSEISMILES